MTAPLPTTNDELERKEFKNNLLEAVSRGTVEEIEAAIQNARTSGIDIVNEALDDDGKTALMIAAENGRADALHLLIVKEGANVDAITKNGKTALMFAAEKGNFVVMAYFLDKWTVNATMKDGSTALMIAARNGHSMATQTLIGKGANVNAITKNGKTALEFVAGTEPSDSETRDRILGILITAGANVKSEAGKAVLYSVSKLSGGYQQNQKTVLSLVAAGADSEDLRPLGFFKRIFTPAPKKALLSNVDIVRKVCQKEEGSKEDKEISSLRELKKDLIEMRVSQVAANLTIAAMVDEGVFHTTPKRNKSSVLPSIEEGKFYNFPFLTTEQNIFLGQRVDSHLLGIDVRGDIGRYQTGWGIFEPKVGAAYGVVGRNTRAGAASRKVLGAETDAAPEAVGVPAGAGTGAGAPNRSLEPRSWQQPSLESQGKGQEY